jgi:hypothetical protein
MQEANTPSPALTISRNGRLHSQDLAFDAIPDVETQQRKTTSDFSKPALIREITINSNQVQQPFEHSYIRVDYSLYIATKAARSQGRVADAKRAEEALQMVFDGFARELSTVAAQMQELMEQRVDAASRDIQYDHKREFTVPVRTGFSMRFLNITQMIDQLAANAETLEINNVLSPQEADQTIRSWVARYRRFCKAINGIRTQSLHDSSGRTASRTNASRKS